MKTRAVPVPSKWIRNRNDQIAVEQGYTFDAAAGERVVKFVETFCRQSKGKWAGKPLELLAWQVDLVMRLYGWRRPDGKRRFRSCYVEVPKKNGKSTLVSGLALYHLVADGEAAAEVYINAYDKAQASIIFDEAARMVASSPDLKKRLETVPSEKLITHAGSNSKLQAMSADVASKDGLNASFTVFDELHRQRTPAMWDIFEYAGISREQPLLLSITTAGHDRHSICRKQHDYTVKVNSGLVEDLTHLGVIYGASEKDDLDDPATWKKANPSMGFTMQEADFRVEYLRAKETPTKLNNFLRLRLGIWTNASERFLDREAWDACGKGIINEELLAGEACVAGLDLASTTDLAALALVFGDSERGYRVVMRFWMPEDNAHRREERDKVPYLTWARQGIVTLTDGNVIDYDAIREEIKLLTDRFEIRKLFADKWNATQLCTQLEADGIDVEYIRQGFASLSPPTKELERLILGRKIEHGDNPCLSWCADNAVAVTDPAGNVKLSKEKSTEKIDGLAALVNAIGALVAGGEADEPSVYEKRGVLFL